MDHGRNTEKLDIVRRILYLIQKDQDNEIYKKIQWMDGKTKIVVTSYLDCTARICSRLVSHISDPVYLLTIIVLIDHPMKNLNHYN